MVDDDYRMVTGEICVHKESEPSSLWVEKTHVASDNLSHQLPRNKGLKIRRNLTTLRHCEWWAAGCLALLWAGV